MKIIGNISRLLIIGACFLNAQPLFSAQIPQQQEEEKKAVASEQVPFVMQAPQALHGQMQQQAEVPVAQNVMNYLRLHGSAAAKRVNDLIRSPKLVGSIPNAITTLIMANLARLLKKSYYKEPVDAFDIISSLFSPGAVMLTAYTIQGLSHISFNEAIINNDIEKARYILATKLLKINDVLDLQGNKIEPPLLTAIRYGRAEIVRLLLENGARLDIKSSYYNGQSLTVQDYVQIQPHDSPAVQRGKLAIQKIILEYKLSQQYPRKAKESTQRKLREQYEPAETFAAEAIEALHKSMYGESGLGQARNIGHIVGSYLTPEYVDVPRKKHATMPIAHPVASLEKKGREEKINLQMSESYEKTAHAKEKKD